MKILMLGWELPPHFVGGMGIVCYNLCDYLARSGADIDFILPFEADYSDIDFMTVNPSHAGHGAIISYQDLHKVNATVYGKADISTKEAKELDIIPLDHINDNYQRKVANVCLYGDYDVIHAHDWLTMRAAILAKKMTGLPLIVHVHATEFDRAGADEGERGNEMIHEIEYQGMMMADKVIAISEWMKNILTERYGIDHAKIEVVHNSIDVSSPYLQAGDPTADDYKYIKKMTSLGFGVITNVGRHTLQKGLTHLLEAMKLALEKNPKILLLMLGSGDQSRELIEKAAELGISSNVIFTGFQAGIRVRDAFVISDAFAMPSVSEPFGLTPLEAMSFGTPVIISKQSGVSEMINTAFKLDFWDVNAIADRIVALTTHKGLRDHMSALSLEESASFSYEKPAKLTNGIYKAVAGVSV